MEALDTRPAVQSILTADTLIQHYARAVKAVARAAGRDDIALSVQIGDANRTYPSIWEHLDHARGLLAAEGRDTADFDRLRAAAGGRDVLGVDTERSEVSDGFNLFSGYYRQQTVTMHFNLRGVELAHRASHALKLIMSDVDWQALALQETIPAPDLRSSSTARWIKWTILGIAAVAFLSVFFWMFWPLLALVVTFQK